MPAEGTPGPPQHYPCNDVGRHQKGLVSTLLFVASCAGEELVLQESGRESAAKGGTYSGHRCLGRRLSSGLSGLDSCGLLGRSIPGRVREVESGEWPLSPLHGLRQVGGLSSFPVTMTMSQSFPFGCGEWEGSLRLPFMPCFLVLVWTGPAVGSRLGRGFGCGCSGQRGGQPSLPCL